MEYVNLNEIADILNGYNFKSSNYVEEGIRVIRITNVQQGYLEDKEPVYYSYSSELERYMLKENDLLMSLTGNVGRVGIISNELLPAGLNQRVACIRCKNSNFSTKYLFYFFNNEMFRKNAINNSNGVAQLNLSTEWLKNVKIPSYSKEEQQKIIRQLDNIVVSIDNKKKEIEILDNLIKSQFIEMFGDLNSNNKGWKIEPLSKKIKLANNGMARRGKDEAGSIVLRLVELQTGYIDYSNPNRISLSESEKNRFELLENDLLFARVNGNPDYVGRCAVFKKIDENVYHNDHIIRVRLDQNEINSCFLSFLINSQYGKRQLKGNIKTSAGQYTISQDGIGSIEVILPPIELQNQFESIFQQIDKSKYILQKQIDVLQELLDSKMEEFFG